jgi:flagellar motility protein MotE (MotC chaperone)
MKDIRLLPIVTVAVAALLMLKGVGLLLGSAGVMSGIAPAAAQQDAPQTPPGDTAAASSAEAGQTEAGSTPVELEKSMLEKMFGGDSRSREAVYESLGERREELEAWARELDLREGLLKAAEQRVEQRIAELKALEARVTRADEERRAEDERRIKALVAMYAEMKPKDAARIFNGLELPILVQVASLMNPRQLSGVVAAMDPAAAQRLTIELSRQSPDPVAAPQEGGELPQIVGSRPAE